MKLASKIASKNAKTHEEKQAHRIHGKHGKFRVWSFEFNFNLTEYPGYGFIAILAFVAFQTRHPGHKTHPLD